MDENNNRGTVRYRGLSAAEVEASRREHGENLMAPPERDPWYRQFLAKFDDPVIRILIIAAVILVSALGFNSLGGLTFQVAGVSITLSGLAIAAIMGILLNAILPGNDYQFDKVDTDTAENPMNMQV